MYSQFLKGNFEKNTKNYPKSILYCTVYYNITFRPSINSQGDSYKQSFCRCTHFTFSQKNVYQQNQTVFVCLFHDCLEDELWYSNVKYNTIPLIRKLVIRMTDYPDRLGPSGNFVENSTKLTCLAITGYRIKYSAVLWLIELQIRRGRKV